MIGDAYGIYQRSGKRCVDVDEAGGRGWRWLGEFHVSLTIQEMQRGYFKNTGILYAEWIE